MELPEDKRGIVRLGRQALARSSKPLVRRGLGLAALVRTRGVTVPENLKPTASAREKARAWLQFGKLCSEADNMDGAVTAYRQATKLDPGLAAAHCELGVALHENGELDGAIVEYRRTIELEPNYGSAHIYLAFALYENGELDGAIAEYRRTIELEPNDGPAHIYLAFALYDKGRLDDAVAEFGKAIDIDPALAIALALDAGNQRHKEAVAEIYRVLELQAELEKGQPDDDSVR